MCPGRKRRARQEIVYSRQEMACSGCWEPSWLENIELRAKKAMKRENIDLEYSHV